MNQWVKVCKEERSEKMVTVQLDRDYSGMLRVKHPWSSVLSEYLAPMLYPMIGRRENIRPKSMLLQEYKVLSMEEMGWNERPVFVEDKYARIGKHYICCRSYNGRHITEMVTMEMRIPDELKESIAARALHPSRLEKWLEKGWEEEWYQYFSC